MFYLNPWDVTGAFQFFRLAGGHDDRINHIAQMHLYLPVAGCQILCREWGRTNFADVWRQKQMFLGACFQVMVIHADPRRPVPNLKRQHWWNPRGWEKMDNAPFENNIDHTVKFPSVPPSSRWVQGGVITNVDIMFSGVSEVFAACTEYTRGLLFTLNTWIHAT